MPNPPRLTPRQARFVEAFAAGLSPEAAMAAAGYSAGTPSCQVRRLPQVRAALAARWRTRRFAGWPPGREPDFANLRADPACRRLTARQQRFVDEYMLDLNAAAAAWRAGFASACVGRTGRDTIGWRLRQLPHVAAEIASRMAERQVRCELYADQVIGQLKAIAFFNPVRLFVPGSRWTPRAVEELEPEALAALRVSVRRGADGKGMMNLRMMEKLPALSLLARHVGAMEGKRPPAYGAKAPAGRWDEAVEAAARAAGEACGPVDLPAAAGGARRGRAHPSRPGWRRADPPSRRAGGKVQGGARNPLRQPPP